MIVSKEYIYTEMVEASLNCWSIKDGKQLIAEQDDEEKSTEAARDMLKRKIDQLPAGEVFTVTLSGTSKKNRKGIESHKVRSYQVETPAAEKTIKGFESNNKQLDDLRSENLRLHKKLIETEYQQKIDALSQRIEGLEAQRVAAPEESEADPIGQLTTALLPLIIEMVTKQTQSKAPNINGLPNEIDTLVNQWLAVDPNAALVIRKIVDLAKSNPTKYNMYKGLM